MHRSWPLCSRSPASNTNTINHGFPATRGGLTFGHTACSAYLDQPVLQLHVELAWCAMCFFPACDATEADRLRSLVSRLSMRLSADGPNHHRFKQLAQDSRLPSRDDGFSKSRRHAAFIGPTHVASRLTLKPESSRVFWTAQRFRKSSSVLLCGRVMFGFRRSRLLPPVRIALGSNQELMAAA